MIYLSTVLLSEKRANNPNLYPYNVFRRKEISPFVFAPITIFYGNNGSGKSTLLNLIAQKIDADGFETYAYGQRYIDEFLGCQFIIASHSPFMLGTLNGKIYNLDTSDVEEAKWTDLDNIRYFYEFFKKREGEFR